MLKRQFNRIKLTNLHIIISLIGGHLNLLQDVLVVVVVLVVIVDVAAAVVYFF
jgi:hypothetical protein